jgi:hypothetical protein
MPACSACGTEIEGRFRFCPWCGHVRRRKLVEFFRPHANSPGRALRVTRYLADEPHVRFSVWEDGVAKAAVSITDEEAERLAGFLRETAAQPVEAER